MSLDLQPPQPLGPLHLLAGFDCGEPSLDDWLQRRALPNQLSGASRTFVVADARQQVLGYYALAAGAVAHADATAHVRRNMPDPVPVMVLARLAVDQRAQGLQLGGALVQDALKRVHSVSQNAGVRALLVHALHEPAKAFYLHYGFVASPINPLTLMMRLSPI